jgi:predicted PurR-regulated permease PerM
MDKRNHFARIYGYLVCLIAVIAFLVCIGNIVAAAFDLSDPLHARGDFEEQRILSSLENYRMNVLGSLPQGQPVPEGESIRAMYEAAREAQIQTVRTQSMRSITVSGLLVVVSVVLFLFHWIWLRRGEARGAAEEAT